MNNVTELHLADNQPNHNPLIADNPSDTMHRVSCMLQYLQSLEHEADGDNVINDDWKYGRRLAYGVMIDALNVGRR
jgi:hypothetical protein